jgi:hypothetical protein
MALLTVQTLNYNGSLLGATAVSASDTFANDGHTVIQVINGGASSDTVTIVSAVPCNQGVNHPITVTVASGTTQLIGPFPTNRFNDANNLVTVTHSYTTSVTCSVYRVNY